MSPIGCNNCEKMVDAVDGLCPSCGAAMQEQSASAPGSPSPEDKPEKTDPNITPPAFLDREDTDPGISAIGDPELDQEEPPAPTTTPARETASAGTSEPVQILRVPWGRITLVLAYLILGGSYLIYEHRSSEGAILNRHIEAAEALLGNHRGAASSNDELIEAARHYLSALAIDRQLDHCHRRIELIKRRLSERPDARLPHEMDLEYKALSSRASLERAESRKGLFGDMPVTPGERFGLHEHRARLSRMRYLIVGGFVLLAGWLLVSASWYRLGSRESRNLEDLEADQERRTEIR